MAKLKGPLFSLGASQQLGKALVFFGWKGLNVVREYVVPANPNTDPQKEQRAWLRAAVADIHDAQAHPTHPLGATDVTAYALWASVVKAATTWFNQAVKNWLDIARLVKVPAVYRDGSTAEQDGQLVCYIYSSSIDAAGNIGAGKFYWGTSKTALINAEPAAVDWGTNSAIATIAGLTNKVKYYWQFRPDSDQNSVGALSGIYYGTPHA